MNEFKLLIDTNVVIGLEDARPVAASFTELVRASGEYGVRLFVDKASYDDISRDDNVLRQRITLSKLAKYSKLASPPLLTEAQLVVQFGNINNDNDRSDVRLLHALDAKAVDFVISEDLGLHRRAERCGLGPRVLTVNDAIAWLHQTFYDKLVQLPYVTERSAHEIPPNDPIFSTLKADYPNFEAWFDKCRREHRKCWVLDVENRIAGVAILKAENRAEAATLNDGEKILKVCTFKVDDEFRGEKFGELLLKKILWYAQINRYELVYLTAFEKQSFLINFLSQFGFERTKELPNSEWQLEKVMLANRAENMEGSALTFDRRFYPRFDDSVLAQKFCVPIQPSYHHRLFPEIAALQPVPLFPDEKPWIVYRGEDRSPGNTIRKVYICRAQTSQMRPGDILFFYMSKGEHFVGSQSVTTVGVVERVTEISTAEELIQQTAKRSVFSAEDLRRMVSERAAGIKMVDFLLVGHVERPIAFEELRRLGVIRGRPQSIMKISEESYLRLKPSIRLGFEF